MFRALARRMDRHRKGPWDYTKNAERLRQLWRMGSNAHRRDERIVIVGPLCAFSCLSAGRSFREAVAGRSRRVFSASS
jgi:hypothetical protein